MHVLMRLSNNVMCIPDRLGPILLSHQFSVRLLLIHPSNSSSGCAVTVVGLARKSSGGGEAGEWLVSELDGRSGPGVGLFVCFGTSRKVGGPWNVLFERMREKGFPPHYMPTILLGA